MFLAAADQVDNLDFKGRREPVVNREELAIKDRVVLQEIAEDQGLLDRRVMEVYLDKVALWVSPARVVFRGSLDIKVSRVEVGLRGAVGRPALRDCLADRVFQEWMACRVGRGYLALLARRVSMVYLGNLVNLVHRDGLAHRAKMEILDQAVFRVAQVTVAYLESKVGLARVDFRDGLVGLGKVVTKVFQEEVDHLEHRDHRGKLGHRDQ